MNDAVAGAKPGASKALEHLVFLDYLRWLAITGVFVFHSLGTAYKTDNGSRLFSLYAFHSPLLFFTLFPLDLGWCGVAIFFVVSGFCIHLSYVRNARDGWKAFFLKRFFRIYPPYLVAVLLFEAIHREYSLRTLLGWENLASHLLLLHNFDPRFIWGINAAFWSIAVEAQLYLLYPILLFFVRRLGWRRALGLVLAIELSLRTIAAVNVLRLPPTIFPRLPEGLPFYYWYSWAIGAALAEAWIKNKPLPFRAPGWPIWLALAAVSWFTPGLAQFSFLLFSIMTAALIAACLNNAAAAHPPARSRYPLLQLMGKFSYSFYLLHQPIVYSARPFLVRRWGSGVNPGLILACCFCLYPIVCAISWLYYHLEEFSIALGKLVIRRPEHRNMALTSSPAPPP